MLKKILVFVVAIVMVSGLSLLSDDFRGKGPRNGNGTGDCRFVDENGDGINDNFRDHDGDGIPNHDDPDWTRPGDGTGYKNGWQQNQQNRNNNRSQTRSSNRNTYRNNVQTGTGTGTCDGTGFQNTRGGNRGGNRRG